VNAPRHPSARHHEPARETRDDGRPAAFVEPEGLLILRKPELFRPGREAFCRRLAEAAMRRGGVRSVRVCLASGTCRLQFPAGRASAPEMAGHFATAVDEALAAEAQDGVRPEGGRGWFALMAFAAAAGDPVSLWEASTERDGGLRLDNPRLRERPGLARRAAGELSAAAGVRSCRAAVWGGGLKVQFDPDVTDAGLVGWAAEDALRRAVRGRPGRETARSEDPAVAGGLRRVWYLALAGGSLVLTLVALVIPGMPTVPFLLATSYYLVRSSPSLNRRLLRSRFFGPIFRDLQTHGGLSPSSKWRLVGLTLVIVAAWVIVLPLTAPLLIAVAVSTTISLYAVARMPGVPDTDGQAAGPGPALAAP
jgi:uncharacterized membrane protein YbaN (DUF454 family)